MSQSSLTHNCLDYSVLLAINPERFVSFFVIEEELRQAAKSSGQCLVNKEDGTGD